MMLAMFLAKIGGDFNKQQAEKNSLPVVLTFKPVMP